MQEFERANTQRVRQLFNSVDELLYERRVSSRSESLQEECEEWNGHTPHLRYSSFEQRYICERILTAKRVRQTYFFKVNTFN